MFDFITFTLKNLLFFLIMLMKKSEVVLKNIIILFLWVILSWIIIFLVQNNPDLTASVLSLSERKYIETKKRDAAYKKDFHTIEVFISERLQKEEKILITFFFSSDLKVDSQKLQSPYSNQILSQDRSNLVVQVTWFQTWNIDEWILILPFVWDRSDITVESIVAWDRDQSVSLWSLWDDLED